MTGSRAQWYNGILLLASFFCCRLLWGTYQSLRVYQDCWAALHVQNTTLLPSSLGAPSSNVTHPTGIPEMMAEVTKQGADLMRYNPHPENIPTWLALTYLGSNVVLNTLNFYWFGKMIETVKKRFQPSEKGKKGKGGGEEEEREVVDVVVEGVELDGRVVEKVVEKAVDGGIKEGKGTGMEKANGEARRRKA